MNKATSIIGAAFVIAIAVVFVVQFRPATGAQAKSGPHCAVEVNGDCIPTTHYWATYRLLAPRNADAASLKAMRLRKLAADALIERHLLNEDAKRLGITVSDDDVSAEIFAGHARVSLPAEKARELAHALSGDQVSARLLEQGIRLVNVKDRKTKRFDTKAYEKEIRLYTQLSPAEFREFERQELIAARMRDLVRARVRISETEALDLFQHDKSTATVDYVKFDRRFYAETVLDTSTKAIEAWAEKHKEDVDKVWEQRKAQYLPECRVARHILAKIDAEGAADPEAAKAAAKKKIDDALERLKNGDSFAEVAKASSDDEGSAIKGGDLGCVAKGAMVKPFEDALFALEAGKTSGIVETEYGFHVIKLEQIAKDADAEKIGRRQVSRDLYTGQESETLAAEGAKQVLAAVRGGKTLADALADHLAQIAPKPKAEGGEKKSGDKGKKDKKTDADKPTAKDHPQRPTVETSLPFNVSGDPIAGVKGQDAAQMAFGLEKAGSVPNDVLPLETGYAVMQLKEKSEATKEQWAKDRDFYMTSMRNKKQIEALGGYLRQLKSRLGSEIKYPDKSITTEAKGEKDDAPQPLDELPEEE